MVILKAKFSSFSTYLIEKQNEIDTESQDQSHILQIIKVTSKEADCPSCVFAEVNLKYKS